MRNLWKLGLSILIIFVATGCAHRTALERSEGMAPEHAAGAPSDSVPPGESELHEVTVKGVLVDYASGKGPTPIIVLANKANDKQILPIWVGMSEGRSINMALGKLEWERPGTHDLFANVLGRFHVNLVKVVVTDLREGTYIATVTMESHGETKDLDARPSDAIALALRCVAPIFVSEEVIRKGGWVKVLEQDEKKTEPKKEGNML
jgi:bifunctional DNase/RNase